MQNAFDYYPSASALYGEVVDFNEAKMASATRSDPGPKTFESPVVTTSNPRGVARTANEGFREVSDTSTDLAVIARDFWQSRYLLGQLARRDIRIRYTQAAMGFAWALLMPMLTVGSGAIIRYILAKTSGTAFQGSDMPGVAIKAVVWGFFVGAMNFGVSSLVGNMSLLTKVAFPREVLPQSAIAAQMFDTLIAAAFLALFIPFFGAVASPQLLWVPFLVLLTVVWTTGLVMLLSCANLFFRDVKYLVQVLLMFGAFFTPVFYEPDMLGTLGANLLMSNPLAAPMEGLRLVVMEGHNLATPLRSPERGVTAWNPLWLGWSVAASLIMLLISVKVFRRSAPMFAERV
jgi:lipopolysaccharide transport system permease protein